MQTFLPYPDFVESAGVLDNKRLGRQRMEVIEILDILHEVHNPTEGWRNHPSVQMWRKYEVSLCEFGLIVCEEWKARGNKDTAIPKLEAHLDWATSGNYRMEKPPWFGNQEFHLGQKAHLIRLDPDFYWPKFPKISPNFPRVWPVNDV